MLAHAPIDIFRAPKSMSDTLDIYWQRIRVAFVTAPYSSDDTWFGNSETTVSGEGYMECRILKFIRCCQDWDRRTVANPANQPSAAEFDHFQDLIGSDLWSMKAGDGTRLQLAGAPYFFDDGTVTWRVQEPSG